MLLTLLLRGAMARRISRPLARHTAITDRFASNQSIALDDIPSTGSSEIRQLGKAFAHMVLLRRSLEEKIREKERFVNRLFESTPVGLALCKMDGTLIKVNPAYAAILGRSVEETLGLNYWQITPEKFHSLEQVQLESLQRQGRYGPYEKEYKRVATS